MSVGSYRKCSIFDEFLSCNLYKGTSCTQTHVSGYGRNVLCVGKKGEIKIDGKVYLLSTGSHVIVEPNEEHELRNPYEEELILECVGIQL